ncbi:hypothetical protein VP01_1861g3 [Puccinia sorghi]|uniref:Uncharacterized protein n=1 Tax=Puccinia sorghi TaxID=27349 RepID=A0A0L6VDE0_9BASI|nr:hypothetical protein VP01_1861g3 [Puccinia sorghi]
MGLASLTLHCDNHNPLPSHTEFNQKLQSISNIHCCLVISSNHCTTHTQYNTQSSSPGTMTSSHPQKVPPVLTMRVKLTKFESIPRDETHSLIVSQRTLTLCKEDWGLILIVTQQADNLEETITTYFNRGLTIQQIHHALKTSHNYQSLKSLKRKLNIIFQDAPIFTLTPKR